MRVVNADDEALLREGLSRLLIEVGCKVVGTAGTAEQRHLLVDAHHPEVAVIDIRMPPNAHRRRTGRSGAHPRALTSTAELIMSHHVDARDARRLLGSIPPAAATC